MTPDGTRKKVAVVEDDREVAALIIKSLAEFHFEVVAFHRGIDFLRKLDRISPHLCIVDLGLPDMDGLDLVRQLAEDGEPVIVLTGRGGVSDRVLGLELGADDYLAKPFEPRELVARVHSLLRRVERISQPSGAVAQFDGWRFAVDAMALTAPTGESVALSRAETQLLEAFLRAPNRVLTRDHLMELRGTASQAYDRSIDVRISRLRQKLRDNPHDPQLIRTVYGTGYLFSAKVGWE